MSTIVDVDHRLSQPGLGVVRASTPDPPRYMLPRVTRDKASLHGQTDHCACPSGVLPSHARAARATTPQTVY